MAALWVSVVRRLLRFVLDSWVVLRLSVSVAFRDILKSAHAPPPMSLCRDIFALSGTTCRYISRGIRTGFGGLALNG